MAILDEFGKPITKTKILSSASFGNGSTGSADIWGKQLAPSRVRLMKEYKSIGYACANLNAHEVQKIEIKLYLRNKTGQATKRYPVRKCGISETKALALRHKIAVRPGEQLEEVLEHPFLTLLHRPNSFMDWVTLTELTQLSQEICGAAYWWIKKNALGTPQEIYFLYPQYMTRLPDYTSFSGTPQYYQYGLGSNSHTFQVDEIVPFIMVDPRNPYSVQEGMSPLAAAFETANIFDKYQGTESAILDNEARPSAIVSPGEEIGEEEAAQWEKRINAKFRRNAGGLFVTDGAATVTPISYSPRDLARLAVYDNALASICMAYGVPPARLTGEGVTQYGVYEAICLDHIERAIVPRLRRNQAAINHFLMSLYDATGKLFAAYENPSPRNREQDFNEATGGVEKGILWVNEGRALLGYEPVEGGNQFAGMYSKDPEGDSEATEQGDTETDTPAEPEETKEAPKLDSRQSLEILRALGDGSITRETAVALFVNAFGMSEAEADKLIHESGEPTEETPEDLPDPASEAEQDDNEDKPEKPGDDKAQKGLVEQESAEGEEANRNLPQGEKLAEVLEKFFARQSKAVVEHLNKGFEAANVKGMKAALPSEFIPLDKWTRELAYDSQPVIEIFVRDAYEREGKELVQRAGASADVFNVTNHKLTEEIRKLTLSFCEATNKTTSKELNEALAGLRSEIEAGLVAGDPIRELTKRVQSVFENAEKFRAKRIAQTEASRSHHAAQRQADIDSGVVTGFKLLLSTRACPLCKSVAAKGPIGLHGTFFEDAKAPLAYQDVKYPPIHPHCQCAMESILDIQAVQPVTEPETEADAIG